jgi:hypothetical protein
VPKRGVALVTPASAAACVAVKVEVRKSVATAAIEMFKVRMNSSQYSRTLNRAINFERQFQFPCSERSATAPAAALSQGNTKQAATRVKYPAINILTPYFNLDLPELRRWRLVNKVGKLIALGLFGQTRILSRQVFVFTPSLCVIFISGSGVKFGSSCSVVIPHAHWGMTYVF